MPAPASQQTLDSLEVSPCVITLTRDLQRSLFPCSTVLALFSRARSFVAAWMSEHLSGGLKEKEESNTNSFSMNLCWSQNFHTCPSFEFIIKTSSCTLGQLHAHVALAADRGGAE